MNSLTFRFLKLALYLIFFQSITSNAQNNKPQVLQVYPTTDSIPVNILRFYIQFSKPMQEMNILQHIQLLDENNQNITGVFYENQYELWNENRTEVTLIVDPGRVKLGLLANNKMGRAFDEGKKYILKIDSLLLDFNDRKLENSFTKNFVAIKEDKIPPTPLIWKLYLPKRNTNEAITIDFKDNIDHISAQTFIKIFRNQKEIQGEIFLNNQEQKWIFKPNKNWKKGNYQIIVNSKLEDITANSVNQIFDHNPNDFKSDNQNSIIDFTIK